MELLTRNNIARVAVMYHFVLEGVLVGVWSSQLPRIRDREDLSNSMLGLCALFSYLGTVVASPFSAFFMRRIGSKLTTVLGAVLYTFSLAAIGFVNDVPLLAVTFFIFGFTMGIMDVSMNTCGVLAETVAGHPIMGSFHGCYSIAAAVGSLLGGGLTSAGWGTRDIFLFTTALGTAFNIIVGQGLYNFDDERRIESKEALNSKDHDKDAVSNLAEAPMFMIPTGPALYVCLVGFLGSFGEGSMVTWIIIYFKNDLDASSLNSTIGFSLFMTFMGLGRFSCDKVRQMIGRKKLIFIEGLLVLFGMSLVVLSPSVSSSAGSLTVGSLGCMFTGAGLSTIVPVVFSTAGRLPGHHAGSAIATAAVITYTGSIISPLMIGGLSDALSSLKWALLIDGVLLSLMTPLSIGVPPEDNFAPLLLDEGHSDNQTPLLTKSEVI